MQLYDFQDIMSRALGYFTNINPQEALVSVDSLRGICTASAMIRLDKVVKIKKSGNCFKIGASGIRLKLKKIPTQDKFTFEIFGISQYYRLSKEAQRQHKELLRYLTSHKSFEILSADIAIDYHTKVMPTMPPNSKYKQSYTQGSLYINTDTLKICVYDKCKKHTNDKSARNLPKKLIRHEVTLNLAKKHTPQKPRKALPIAKTTSQAPLIRNNKRILKKYYNTKKFKSRKKTYRTRDFFYKHLSKKCSTKPYSSDTS